MICDAANNWPIEMQEVVHRFDSIGETKCLHDMYLFLISPAAVMALVVSNLQDSK